MCRNIFLALLSFTLGAKQSWAQCLGSCACTAANTEIAGHPTGDKKGRWLITAGYSAMQYAPFTDEELKEWSTETAPVYSVTSQHTVRLGVQYNITDRLRAGVTMPYSFSFDNREGMVHGGTHVMVNHYENIAGFGDATLIARYQWLNNENWNLETGLGMKFPTGQTNTTSSNGLTVPQHLQPGTGSWDPVATLQVRREWDRWSVSEDVFGKLATTANDHNMGDYIGATTSANYRLIQQSETKKTGLAIFGGALVEYNSKMEMPPNHHHGSDPGGSQEIVPFDNSGFTRIMVLAGVVVYAGSRLSIPLNFSLPAYEHYNGYQVSMKWKLAASVNLSL